MSEALLKIDNLSVDYETSRGVLRALRDITFDVQKGEIVGIVGESGCGKSTLISSIMRLVATNTRFRSGTVTFKGQDILRMPEDEIRDLRGPIFPLFFKTRCRHIIRLFQSGSKWSISSIAQLRQNLKNAPRPSKCWGSLAFLTLRSGFKQFPHEFSGGMRQRIAIAMALMSKPDLLIADEPTTALDATLEVQIIERLKELQRDFGCAILFISHHLGVIAELCDRVVVMYAGAVIESGDVREIFHNPKHPYTRRLIECDPGHIKERTRRLPTISGEVPDLVDLPGGCIFRERCDQAKPRCTTETPTLDKLGEGHYAACWLNHEEVAP